MFTLRWFNGVFLYFLGIQCAIDVAAELRIKYTIPKVCTAHAQAFTAYLRYEVVPAIFGLAVVYLVPGGVLNFELGTDVRPEVSTTTL